MRTPYPKLMPSSLLGALVFAAGVASCSSDPTLSNLVKRQGPEADGVPKGEFHRSGQQCLACHISGGPAKPEFSMAGTVYLRPPTAQQRDIVGVDQVEVLLIDSAGNTKRVNTNCVGNFYIEKKDFEPRYPARVAVFKEGFQRQTMQSLIGRDGSCATCHAFERALDSAGVVYLTTDANAQYTPPEDCPVDPVITLPDPE
jgi:mono/diheme cytochrome c family protein